MSNLIKLEFETDVKQTIEAFLKNSDQFSSVILLGLDKECRQHLMTSSCSGQEKAFMTQFLNAWMNKWFEL